MAALLSSCWRVEFTGGRVKTCVILKIGVHGSFEYVLDVGFVGIGTPTRA